MKNGDLLRAARATGFEVFLTADQGIPYEQNLVALRLATVILAAPSTSPAHLEPLMPRVAEALAGIAPGDVITVAA